MNFLFYPWTYIGSTRTKSYEAAPIDNRTITESLEDLPIDNRASTESSETVEFRLILCVHKLVTWLICSQVYRLYVNTSKFIHLYVSMDITQCIHCDSKCVFVGI